MLPFVTKGLQKKLHKSQHYLKVPKHENFARVFTQRELIWIDDLGTEATLMLC
jgi:hypothetical protein